MDDLEVRFLGNHDPNIYFALLTDLPDSREPSNEDDPIVDYCAQLIRELNEKYAGEAGDRFCFSIAIGSTIRAKECGWAGNENAAS